MSWNRFGHQNKVPIIKSDVIDLYNIEAKIIEYEKYFNETKKKSDFDVLKNIEIIVKLFNKSWDKIDEVWYKENNICMYSATSGMHSCIFDKDNKSEKLHKMIVDSLFYYNNVNYEVIKSILKIFEVNHYIYSINRYERNVIHAENFVDIDILKSTNELVCKYELLIGGIQMDKFICNYIKDTILYAIYKYSDDIINTKVEELKRIIANLNILNYNSDICNIAEFLCKHLQSYNFPQSKKKYDFIFKLHRYIYCELNLLDSVDFSNTLTKLLKEYKIK